MDYYDKLESYFPEHELKHPEQLEDLLSHHLAYRKWETPQFLVLYADFRSFIFIDYLLVNPSTRGSGIGSKVVSQLKSRGKTLVLEVEPSDADDKDTVSRIRFYEKNGFHKAEHIDYVRQREDGSSYQMLIYYWSPSKELEETILNHMATVCDEIHNFRAKKYYEHIPAEPDEVLQWADEN